MRGINTVHLLGNAGRTPDPHKTATGKLVCELSLATNRSRKTGDGWVQETEWHRVTLWERDADRAIQHIRPGTPVAVEGYLKTDSWTDAKDQKHSRTTIVARRLEILGRPPRFDAAAPTRAVPRMDDTAGAPMMAPPSDRPGPLLPPDPQLSPNLDVEDIPF